MNNESDSSDTSSVGSVNVTKTPGRSGPASIESECRLYWCLSALAVLALLAVAFQILSNSGLPEHPEMQQFDCLWD